MHFFRGEEGEEVSTACVEKCPIPWVPRVGLCCVYGHQVCVLWKQTRALLLRPWRSQKLSWQWLPEGFCISGWTAQEQLSLALQRSLLSGPWCWVDKGVARGISGLRLASLLFSTFYKRRVVIQRTFWKPWTVVQYASIVGVMILSMGTRFFCTTVKISHAPIPMPPHLQDAWVIIWLIS